MRHKPAFCTKDTIHHGLLRLRTTSEHGDVHTSTSRCNVPQLTGSGTRKRASVPDLRASTGHHRRSSDRPYRRIRRPWNRACLAGPRRSVTGRLPPGACSTAGRPDHGPYSLHTRYRPCGDDSRVVPPPAGRPLALRSGPASTRRDRGAGQHRRASWQDGPGPAAGRPQVATLDVRRRHLRACGNLAERRWNETIFGLRITPSRISIARRIVWSRSQAPGPFITVRRCGISASLISQVAEFHR
jgi:hypothetical protein